MQPYWEDACLDRKDMTMANLEKRAETVGVTGALMLLAMGWAASAEAATGISPAVDARAAIAEALGDTVRADLVLGAAIPTSTTLRPTLQQRRRSGGDRRVAQPRRGGARTGRPGARGGRTVVVRGGRYYSPYYFGLGYGYGYPYFGGGYYGYGYPYFGGGYYGYYGGSYSYTGSVRLKVKPRAAEVLVDGYYVGTVDNFDGTFQSLKLEPGPASMEIRAPGFESLRLDVRILPGRKITFEENMRAGDPGEARPPSAARRPPAQGPDPAAAEGRPVPPDRDAEPGPPAGYDRQPPAFGGVRLRVEPRHARVFVDGYYVGTVDDFDSGRGLPLESGPQSIEIRADGYESLQLQVRILPDETITYEGDLTAAPGQQD